MKEGRGAEGKHHADFGARGVSELKWNSRNALAPEGIRGWKIASLGQAQAQFLICPA